MRRLVAPLVIVAFFAALPAWFLSTREGWIAIDCARRGAAAGAGGAAAGAPLDCTVRERFAFGSRSATYPTLGARGGHRQQHGRRGKSSSYQLVLVTPDGEREVLRDHTGNAALAEAAAQLDTAARSGAPAFRAEVSPDAVFWIAVVVLALFTAAGLFLARSRFVRDRERAADREPAPLR